MRAADRQHRLLDLLEAGKTLPTSWLRSTMASICAGATLSLAGIARSPVRASRRFKNARLVGGDAKKLSSQKSSGFSCLVPKIGCDSG